MEATVGAEGGGTSREERVMTFGIPTDLFLQIHVVISLIGIASGLVVLYGLVSGKLLAGWTALFLGSTILTCLAGFPLPPFGFDPPRALGIISLVLLAAAVLALYVFRPAPGAGSTSSALSRRS